MTVPTFSSGNPVLDRRADFAQALARTGDPKAAAEVLLSALVEAPLWLSGWAQLAAYYTAAENPDQARATWVHLLSLDPADPFGASLYLDLARDTGLAETMPPAFVENLFDQYAPRFDQSLVKTLAYQGPALIMSALLAQGRSRFDRTLDLGCGTGLMGQAIRAHTGHLTGIDLSAAMLEQARAKSLYDQLVKNDMAHLPLAGPCYDLILAADVFIYVGALEQITAWVAARLTEGGTFAFTVEEHQDPYAEFTLQPSQRFAHSEGYLTRLLAAAGLTPPQITRAAIRRDRGADVQALIVTTTLAPQGRAIQNDGEDMATA